MFKIKDTNVTGFATFSVTAQFSSFTQAAHHLHMTTGAVSQQIKNLEDKLGLLLFIRHSRGIKLTDAGEQLSQVLNQSFTNIQAVITQLQQQQTRKGEVHLKLTPSFAFKWIVPRLQDFYKQYPDIKIHTFAEGGLVDHQNHNFDLAIDYGKKPYQQDRHKGALQSELLMAEQLLPVMSTSYLAKFDWTNQNAEVQQQIWQQATLLHDSMPWSAAERNEEWRYWFNKMKLNTINLNDINHHDHYFNRTDMAMAAAAAGLGIALARSALIDKDLANENLVSPFDYIDANAGYYLIQHRNSPAIDCFKAWLIQQVKTFKAELG